MERGYAFTLIIILSLTPLQVIGQGGINSLTILSDMKYDYSRTFTRNDSYEFIQPEILSYVETNITDTAVRGGTTYGNDEVISGLSIPLFIVNVSAVRIDVVDDKDSNILGAGEIFLEGVVNGNYLRHPEGTEYSINSGESMDIIAPMFYGESSSIDIKLEIREADPGQPDDSLGFISYINNTPDNATLILTTDTGDATVTFDISVIPLQRELTAGELLQGYMPYIFVDDETGNTELPEVVAARVSRGIDGTRDSLVLQYYFYWTAEYAPDGGTFTFMLHENDFEPILIYLDFNNPYSPYRIVLNNYQYTDLPGFPNEDLLIVERGATEFTMEYQNNITEEYAPLLGATATQSATTIPYSALENWEYSTFQTKDVRRSSSLGFETVELTVDTSYHTFDFGPGGTEYGYVLNVTELSPTLIRQWYSELEGTFANGTHSWSYVGIDVPVTAPFSFDVSQLFNAPYVISTYSEIANNVGAIQVAKNSGLNMTHSLEVGISVIFPVELDITYPESLRAGQEGTVSVTLSDSGRTEFILFYNYTVSVEFAYWFVQLNTSYSLTGNVTFDIDRQELGTKLNSLGLSDGSVGDIDLLGEYLILSSLTISPNFIGKILEGVLVLDVWTILVDIVNAFLPSLNWIIKVLDFFIDGIDLVADIVLEGTIHTTLQTTSKSTITGSDMQFSADSLTKTAIVRIDDDSTEENAKFEFTELVYDLTLSVSWSVNLTFSTVVAKFVSDRSWTIGTYPSLTSNPLTGQGGSFAVTVVHETSSTTSDDTGKVNIPGTSTSTQTAPLQHFYLLVSMVSVVIFVGRTRRRPLRK